MPVETEAWRIVPLGDCAMIIELGRHVDVEISARIQAAAQAILLAAIPGVTDVVPAFTTLCLHYRPESFDGGSPYEALRGQVEALLSRAILAHKFATRVVEIPVCYGGQWGPDLEEVAAACQLTADEVITRHIASNHVVGMLGFAPGFPYLIGLDRRLAMPRRATPRTAVPAGSVAIARDQCAIYPLETPGGWNLIGRTPLRLFDPTAHPPCLLAPGDQVRFVPISADAFRTLAAPK